MLRLLATPVHRTSCCRAGKVHLLMFISTIWCAGIWAWSGRGVWRFGGFVHHVGSGIVLLFCIHGSNLGPIVLLNR